jgi:hypothetical protein
MYRFLYQKTLVEVDSRGTQWTILRNVREIKPLEINDLRTSMDSHGTQQNKIIGAGNEIHSQVPTHCYR